MKKLVKTTIAIAAIFTLGTGIAFADGMRTAHATGGHSKKETKHQARANARAVCQAEHMQANVSDTHCTKNHDGQRTCTASFTCIPVQQQHGQSQHMQPQHND